MAKTSSRTPQTLHKTPTGIAGFDEVTMGGLPTGRTTLICGGAGSGKTLIGLHYLIRGITEYGENGVLMSFEERSQELAENVASFGFDVNGLIRAKKLAIDYVRIERSEIEETGAYDLEGLFVRLNYAIESVGAKRVVLDTIEALFAGLSDSGTLRAEMRRLFAWMKERGVTAIVTAERGDGTLTRHGLEEYVSDCVVLLDHRVHNQVSTRRMRIVKYRGSSHGTNEYPFIINRDGIHILPVTSIGLQHGASTQRISSGIPRLDNMLGGKGFYRGSSVLISGSAGTGKSSVAAHFVNAACARGERSLYFAFEESPSAIVRNMRSIGIDFQPWIDKGLLHIQASRPTAFGLESHLLEVDQALERFDPVVVVFDPISNMVNVGSFEEVREMLMRLVDTLKAKGITALCTALSSPGTEASDVGVSSLMDTWLLLREIESHGERTRGLFILKSRGMAHSNQIREFVLTDHGVELVDVYVGSGQVLTGTARVAQEQRERADTAARELDLRRKESALAARRRSIETQIEELRRQLKAEEAEFAADAQEQVLIRKQHAVTEKVMAAKRYADRLPVKREPATPRSRS